MVRFAEEKDLPRVNELRYQVGQLHAEGRPDIFKSDIFKSGFPKDLQDLAYKLMQAEEGDVLVAEREGVICGMACVEYQNKQESPYTQSRRIYHITEFAVDDAFRRQGVGRELMTFIGGDARSRGFSSIELEMWDFNEPAREFYEAVGFRTFRRVMEWDLLKDT